MMLFTKRPGVGAVFQTHLRAPAVSGAEQAARDWLDGHDLEVQAGSLVIIVDAPENGGVPVCWVFGVTEVTSPRYELVHEEDLAHG